MSDGRAAFLIVMSTCTNEMLHLFRVFVDIFDFYHLTACNVFRQIEETLQHHTPKRAGAFQVNMKQPIICEACRGWFVGQRECQGCTFECRELVVSWNYWLWGIMAQIHGMLRSTFRERRGVVTLLGVPPQVGFALMNYFGRPRPAGKESRAVYDQSHSSWRQGTSKGKKYHFIKFSYDTMEHAEWAFPLHDYYPKTSVNGVRLVTKGRISDPRWWGTPIQFKYKWAVQSKLGVPTPGVHTFTIMSNIGAITLVTGQEPLPRWNFAYKRWVVELQQEQLVSVKKAIVSFPVRPFRCNHKLAGVTHPLKAWAEEPTLLPSVAPVPAPVSCAGHVEGSGDEGAGDESDDEDDALLSLSEHDSLPSD